MTRVLLVDDHPVVREGIRRVLRGAFPDLTFGEADSGEQAIALCETVEWDVVILDISLPRMNGIDVIDWLRRTAPATRIVVVSMHEPRAFAHRALAGGATAYVEKRAVPEELIKAVSEAMAGRTFVSGAWTAAGRAEDRPPARDRLSDREYQILRMLGTGKTVSSIAQELALSVKTISTYRSRLLVKLRLRTTAELIHYAIDRGLVP